MAGGRKKDVGRGLGRKEQCCRRAVMEGWIEEREGSMHGVERGGADHRSSWVVRVY